MATTLIFIRHGESEGNLRHVFLGQHNAPLTPLGIRQAELAAASLDGTPIDAIYSSDLSRAMMTAEPLARRRGLPIQPEPGFREIFAGKWETHTYEELPVLFPEDFHTWRTDIGRVRCTGGESTAELQQRVLKAVRQVAARHPGQTVCVVTHATALRSMKCAWLGLPVEQMQQVPWPKNASVTVVRCEDDGRTVIEVDDSVEHLGDIVTVVPTNLV